MNVNSVPSYRMSFAVKAVLLVLIALGVLGLHLHFQESAVKGWSSYLIGCLIFLGLGLCGLFFTAIQHITSARWSTSLRRVMETMSLTLPVAALLGIGIYFSIHHIYEWSHAEVVARDHLLQWKAPYLNESFFTLRLVIYFLVWIAAAAFLARNSFKQDRSADIKLTWLNKNASSVVIILFALTVTMAGFDLLMSLEPHWFSTMLGVRFFAGFFQAGLAVTIVLTWMLWKSGVFKDFVNIDHFYELGKFLYGFSVFWGYIAFCEYMLIWYANLPEETFYFIERSMGGWQWWMIAALVLRLFVPLLIILPYSWKRNFKVLIPVCFVILIGHWIELFWMVKPAMRLVLEIDSLPATFGWKDVFVGTGFFALFFLVVGLIMERVRMVPVGDPRLEASIHHHV